MVTTRRRKQKARKNTARIAKQTAKLRKQEVNAVGADTGKKR
jgi:hypothetical protein